jgi:hypothetical protein
MKVEVGMKAKGFKHEGPGYADIVMDAYVGKQGVVENLDGDSFCIRFEDGDFWYYPTSLAHRALISVGDKVKIPKTKSVGDEESESIRSAKRASQDYLYYVGEKDGKLILNNELNTNNCGDYFTLEDIELYENNMRTIKKSELKKIHDVACSTWQGKIKALANRNPWGVDIELSEEEVSEMFAAASASQKVVLEEVFGKQNKEIDLASEDINHIVDRFPVFGGSSAHQDDVLISLPSKYNITKNRLFLNRNYNWELNGNCLIVTRK